jgi:four helix bundle protein
MTNHKLSYDLEERTTKFGEQVIVLCQEIKQNVVTNPIIGQLVKSATSIGANYSEANGASSKKDFRNKIFICKKESQETKYWLKILLKCAPYKKDEILRLATESHELILIFSKICSTLNNKLTK